MKFGIYLLLLIPFSLHAEISYYLNACGKEHTIKVKVGEPFSFYRTKNFHDQDDFQVVAYQPLNLLKKWGAYTLYDGVTVGKHHWTFRATAPGITKLRFERYHSNSNFYIYQIDSITFNVEAK